MKRIYLDYAAAAPVDPRVIETMSPYFTEKMGNPSAVYTEGRQAMRAIQDARYQVANLIGANSEDIVFTSGSTESNNLALLGAASHQKLAHKHIITTVIEHISVLEICKFLEVQGYDVTYLHVDHDGLIDFDDVLNAITDDTFLISVMYANNEIGTIQPIPEIGKIAHEKGILFHVDAVAALGKIPINVETDQIDLMTIASNDIYGPRGVGALYIKNIKKRRIQPLFHGGGQERNYRSGSENVPSIIGFGTAAEITKKEMKTESQRLKDLRDTLIEELLTNIPSSALNGHRTKRLPTNANLRFKYVEGESLVLSLDMEGFTVATGSACTSKSLEPSHVLTAIGLPQEEAHGSLQFTLGRWTTKEDITRLLEVLPDIVKRLRAMSPLTPPELLSK
ncbi:MAG: cysteine desulfurase family protein [Candidatus Heimdallarchaeota archaeon]